MLLSKLASFKHDFTLRFTHQLNFKTEFSAGLAAAIVSLPQSMAYGIIAFAPLGSDYISTGILSGLYSAIFVGLCSALFGSTNILISGSRAATALVFSALVGHLLASASTTISNEAVVAYAFLAVFLSGLFQAGLGITRVGNLAKYVPYPVIAGFLNGSALSILIGQFWLISHLPRNASMTELAHSLSHLPFGEISFTLLIVAFTLWVPRHITSVPAAAISLLLGSLAYHTVLHFNPELASTLGTTIGTIEVQIPQMALLSEDLSTFFSTQTLDLLPLIVTAALSMAAISSLDTLLSTVTLDSIFLNRTRGNKELIAQGIGNLLSSLFHGIPGSGSMARTMPAIKAGGKTQLSNLFNILLLMMAIFIFPPLISKVPQAVMSGILLVIGIQLLDQWTLELIGEAIRKRGHINKVILNDLIIIAIVVAVTLIWNLMIAVMVGIVLAAVMFIRTMSRSMIRRIYSGTHVHARRYSGEQIVKLLEAEGHRIRVIELEGTVFFGSADKLEQKIDELIAEGVSHFVLDMKRIKDIDSSGARVLQRIYQRLQKSGLFLAISYIESERRSGYRPYCGQDRRQTASDRSIWINLQHLGVIDVIGRNNFWHDTDSALGACECDLLERLHSGTPKELEIFNDKSSILNDLSEGDIQFLIPLLSKHEFRAGEIIFSQGSEGNAIYILTKGAADVTLNLVKTDRKKRVQTLLPGSVFGEMAVLDDKPRAANVIAIQPTICYRLAKEDFIDLKKNQPDIAFKLISNICLMFVSRLRTANEMIMELEI